MGRALNVFQDEYSKIEKDLVRLRKQLTEYPKGSLRIRTIKGRDYYYLQYREGKHVRSRYISEGQVPDLKRKIEERRALEKDVRALQARAESYAKLLGVHRTYRPVKDVNYEEYTLFMSSVAHDYKSLDQSSFIEKYDISKYRGINKRYIAGFLDHVNGIDRQNIRRTNDLVLDPYTYLMYFKYGDKDVLRQELNKAIPAFLCRGLLITNIQEAVNGTSG